MNPAPNVPSPLGGARAQQNSTKVHAQAPNARASGRLAPQLGALPHPKPTPSAQASNSGLSFGLFDTDSNRSVAGRETPFCGDVFFWGSAGPLGLAKLPPIDRFQDVKLRIAVKSFLGLLRGPLLGLANPSLVDRFREAKLRSGMHGWVGCQHSRNMWTLGVTEKETRGTAKSRPTRNLVALTPNRSSTISSSSSTLQSPENTGASCSSLGPGDQWRGIRARATRQLLKCGPQIWTRTRETSCET